MPARRALSGAFTGASDVFGTLMRSQLQEEISNRAATRNDQLERGRTADNLIAQGKLNPEDREKFIRGDYSGPNIADRVHNIVSGIDKAPTMGEVPSRESLASGFQAARVPLTSFGVAPKTQAPVGSGGGSGNTDDTLASTPFAPIESPEFRSTLDVRAAKLRAFPAEKVGEEMTGEGGNLQAQNIYGKHNPDTGAMERTNAVPAGPTAQQKGTFEGTQQAQTENLTRAGKVQTTVDTENAMRVPRTQTAAAETLARVRAETQGAIQRAALSGGLLPEQAMAANELASQFQSASAPYWVQEESFRKIVSHSQTASSSPAASMGVIFGYMKLLDPNSSVREGEQATAQNAQGVPDWILNLYNKTTTGAKLSPAQVQDFVGQSKNLYSAATEEHQHRVQEFATRAAMRKIPQELVVRSPAPGMSRLGSTKVVNGRVLKATAVDAQGNVTATEDVGAAPIGAVR